MDYLLEAVKGDNMHKMIEALKLEVKLISMIRCDSGERDFARNSKFETVRNIAQRLSILDELYNQTKGGSFQRPNGLSAGNNHLS
jgi:hypothetical protein